MSDSQKKIWDLIGHCTQEKVNVSFTASRDVELMIGSIRSSKSGSRCDNRQSMHRASAYDEKMGGRDVRRSTIYDDEDAAMGVAAPVGALTIPVTKTEETVVPVTPVEQLNI